MVFWPLNCYLTEPNLFTAMFIIPSLLELDEEDCPKLKCLGIQVSFIRITFICKLKIEMSNVKN